MIKAQATAGSSLFSLYALLTIGFISGLCHLACPSTSSSDYDGCLRKRKSLQVTAVVTIHSPWS
jgi:hypothetical protein